MSEQIKKYLRQLQEALSPAPPISVENLKSLHAAQDYKGMVQLIKRSMNIEEVTFRVLWVPDGVADERAGLGNLNRAISGVSA